MDIHAYIKPIWYRHRNSFDLHSFRDIFYIFIMKKETEKEKKSNNAQRKISTYIQTITGYRLIF